jgi:hypothetical protein
MNIKQFYIIIFCKKLPQEITEYIWKLVKYEAANTIASAYFKKVAINVLFFQYLLNFDVDSVEIATSEMTSKTVSTVNNVIKNNMYKITYKYIQEPGTWIKKLEDILTLYSYCINIGVKSVDIENIHYMLNSIKNNSELYNVTGLEWWEYF